ncbi:PfkB family carbohydrate kinase [Olivibacter ginsenosidimutans]|uniref:PfkB family carbohydrate kinase n=1 Tax=Olivibacter ginsenosidimutans TaxID=1176537 RepID=A0ABP9CBH4_9SPHI
MFDVCCIGHITLDKVIIGNSQKNMPGGTSFYFANAIKNMDISFGLVTAVGAKEQYIIDQLQAQGITVTALPSKHTVYFENSYNENQDHRTQRVLQKADAFTVDQLANIQAKIFHLGPLLADDIPAEVIKHLSTKGTISLDVQGYLRKVSKQKVFHTDWLAKGKVLPYVDILKANEFEMEALTGTRNIDEGIRILADYGIKEVIITLGSKGSVLFHNRMLYQIPAYIPEQITDATGCGDTYMAGYLFKKVNGSSLREAGEFAAAMATLKLQTSGPFTGGVNEVSQVLEKNGKIIDQHAPIETTTKTSYSAL